MLARRFQMCPGWREKRGVHSEWRLSEPFPLPGRVQEKCTEVGLSELEGSKSGSLTHRGLEDHMCYSSLASFHSPRLSSEFGPLCDTILCTAFPVTRHLASDTQFAPPLSAKIHNFQHRPKSFLTGSRETCNLHCRGI